MRGEPAEGGAHRRPVRDGGEDDLGPAELCQLRGRIAILTVDVKSRAEFPGERLLVLAASDGNGTEAHLRRVLNAEVAEPTDAEDRDEVARACAAVAQRVESGEAGAHERGRIGGG